MLQIPLIPQDLRQEELVLQIEASFTALQKATSDVFTRIESKIDGFRQELEDVDQRTAVCRQKVQMLKGAGNRVIRIFSGYKYPGPEVTSTDYKSLTDCNASKKGEPVGTGLSIKSTHVPFDDEVLKEKLQFYHKPKVGRSNQILDFLETESPLGRIPWERISTVGSLVMFNSSENPYVRRSHGSSSLYDQKLKSKKAQVQGDDGDGFAPAPASMTQRTDDEDPDDSFLRYDPDLEVAPAIIESLPSALPDLPGVADDLFSDNFEFPDSSLLFRPTPTSPPPQLSTTAPSIQASYSPPVATSVVPPAPPFMAPSVPSSRPETSQPQVSQPPPPPPPPPPLEFKETEKSDKASTSTKPSVPSGDENRASLLDAIRKAGGKPKKGAVSVKDLKIEKKKSKQKEVVTGDLMADLAKTLTARRVGISGTNTTPIPEKPRDTNPGSALDRVASMIPPPPKPSAVPHADEDDDSDWE